MISSSPTMIDNVDANDFDDNDNVDTSYIV